MQDEPFYPLGCLDGAEVGVQSTPDGQQILIQDGDLGQRLASLLAYGKTEMVRRGGVLYWRVPHDPEVDRLLVELTDLFISIRYAHPTLVQNRLIRQLNHMSALLLAAVILQQIQRGEAGGRVMEQIVQLAGQIEDHLPEAGP